ncbi:hypothetical protein AMTRI_Chr03g51340 [Amborella trichopoda]
MPPKQLKVQHPRNHNIGLIQSCASSKMAKGALELFFAMPHLRCQSSATSLNALLSVLCDTDSFHLVPELLIKTLEMNIRLDAPSFRILIGSLCRIGKLGFAIELLHLKPDQGSKGGRLNEARAILNRMKSEGAKPDTITHTSLMDGFYNIGEFKQAGEVFDEMLSMGLVPDVFTYSVYINGLCRERKLKEGMEVLCVMREMGCRPNVITYNTLIRTFCSDGKLRRADELVAEMASNGLCGNSVTYRTLINTYLRECMVVEANELLLQMVGKGFFPNFSTRETLLSSTLFKWDILQALNTLEELISRLSR